MGRNSNKIKNILILQAVIVIYTISSVMAKLASVKKENLIWFFGFFAADLFLLGVYAILWQQMIKRFELTIAYANRAMAILWSMVWAALFFHERITWKNIVGVLIVLAGTIIMNTEKEKKQNDE